MNNLSKVIIIILLVVVVAVTLYLKARPAGKEAEISAENPVIEKPSFEKEDQTEGMVDASEQKAKLSEIEQDKPKGIKSEKAVAEKIKKEKPSRLMAESDILAVVNDEKISIQEFERSFNRLPRQNREMIKDNKELYLDQLVLQLILKQELQKRGLVTEYSTEREIQNEANKFLDKMSMETVVEVSEEEMREFYNENQGQMQGMDYAAVAEDIRAYLHKQKQLAVSENYVKELQEAAEVDLNEEWVQKQLEARPKDPLTEALQNGMATVLDLGSDSCIPCKMMKPIFAELEEGYKDKANILLLMIADYRGIANRYNVRVIPTQIFFDQNGEQYYRHEGFMAKEDIIAKLKEAGVE